MRIAARLRSLAAGEGGYSLPELVVVMAILGTVMGAVTTMLVSGTNAELEMNARFQAQTQARIALDRLRREIHCASSVTPTGASDTVTLSFPSSCPAIGGTSATWCRVSAGTNRWQLWRYDGTSCSGSGRVYADYLYYTSGTSFTYYAQSISSLAKLAVSLPVNTRPSKFSTYKLEDTIVLRNSTRT